MRMALFDQNPEYDFMMNSIIKYRASFKPPISPSKSSKLYVWRVNLVTICFEFAPRVKERYSNPSFRSSLSVISESEKRSVVSDWPN